jgi:hypothetical protein
MLRIGRSLPQILLVWIVKLEKQQDVLLSFLRRRDGYVFLVRCRWDKLQDIWQEPVEQRNKKMSLKS